MFWLVIIPEIQHIVEKIGCKYLYLFAADVSRSKKSLINYYVTDLKFTDDINVMIIKPDYDKNCYSLVQEINDLDRHSLEFINSYDTFDDD